MDIGILSVESGVKPDRLLAVMSARVDFNALRNCLMAGTTIDNIESAVANDVPLGLLEMANRVEHNFDRTKETRQENSDGEK